MCGLAQGDRGKELVDGLKRHLSKPRLWLELVLKLYSLSECSRKFKKLSTFSRGINHVCYKMMWYNLNFLELSILACLRRVFTPKEVSDASIRLI